MFAGISFSTILAIAFVWYFKGSLLEWAGTAQNVSATASNKVLLETAKDRKKLQAELKLIDIQNIMSNEQIREALTVGVKDYSSMITNATTTTAAE